MWGRLLVAGLLLAGCAFDRGGSSASRSDTDAAAGGAADARPHGDGGSDPFDGAPPSPDATPAEPVLLDTLTVPASGDVITSSAVLASGQSYRLVASGTLVARTENGNYTADSEYVWEDDLPGVRFDSADGVDLGMAINDTVVDGNGTPDWGEFSSSHSYESTLTGTGAALTAQFHDPDYDNGNSGSLTLEIWGPPP